MNCVIISKNTTVRSALAEYSEKALASLYREEKNEVRQLLISIVPVRADLVIYDMDSLDALELENIKEMQVSPLFIMISSVPENAVLSYELGAIDFLLDPFSPERIMRSFERVKEIIEFKRDKTGPANSENPAQEYIFVKSGNQIHRINVDEILYFEKDSNYFVMHFRSNKKLLIRINFSNLLSLLPEHKFMRVHKSYVVGFRHIDYIEGNSIVVNKEHIPIAITYKNEFLKAINA